MRNLYGFLDGVKLLRDIEACPACFDHLRYGTQMPFAALQTLHDIRMSTVAMFGWHKMTYPLERIYQCTMVKLGLQALTNAWWPRRKPKMPRRGLPNAR